MPQEFEKLAHCRVILEGTEHTYEGDSGEDGLINFERLEEDVYTLTVQKKGYEDYVEEGIVIDPEHKTLRSKVSLKELPHVITIVFLTTPEVENATITLIDIEGHIAYHGKTDSEGQLTIPKVEYGKYVLKVKAKGFARYTKNITVNSTNKNPRTIEAKLKALKPREQDPEPDTDEEDADEDVSIEDLIEDDTSDSDIDEEDDDILDDKE